MKPNDTYKNKQILINDVQKIFSYPIRDVKRLGNTDIVILDIPQNDNTIDNLYAVNNRGEIIWRSQPLKEIYPTEKLLPYEQIIIKDQEIRAIDFYGRCYFINPNDGMILKRIIYK